MRAKSFILEINGRLYHLIMPLEHGDRFRELRKDGNQILSGIEIAEMSKPEEYPNLGTLTIVGEMAKTTPDPKVGQYIIRRKSLGKPTIFGPIDSVWE